MTPFNIVLYAPEIPQNTGTIGRLAVSTNSRLHLIEPLGFSLEDKFLKRAGLDYWEYLAPSIYPDWETFLAQNKPERMFFISTHGNKDFFDANIHQNEYDAIYVTEKTRENANKVCKAIDERIEELSKKRT